MQISETVARGAVALAMAALLAGCGEQKTDHATLAKYEAQQNASSADDGRIMCAEGDAALARACTIEREMGDDGLVLTLRHPDGAFRRLLVTKDGRGVIAADGAETASVSVRAGNEIEVALGGNRYRLPATVKAAKPAS